MKHLELHIIQSVPVACLNRDDLNSPKTAVFGGVQRARVSSQSWKRAIREMMAEKDFDTRGQFKGQRSRLFIEKINELLTAVGEAETTAKALSLCAGHYLAKIDPKHEGKVKTLMFLSPLEYEVFKKLLHSLEDPDKQKLADAVSRVDTAKLASEDDAEDDAEEETTAKQNKGDKKLSPKAFTKVVEGVLKKLVKKAFKDEGLPKDAADIALFGRMVANDHSLTVEAAGMFSHALSTHKADNEIDFFAAVDDLQSKEESGAGMTGTLEFNSATYYRFAALNLDMLADAGHLASMTLEERQAVVRTFVEATIKAIPGARRYTMNGNTLPDFVLGVVREKGHPVQLVNAFENPLRSNQGYAAESVKRLKAEYEKLKSTWGIEAVLEKEIPEMSLPSFLEEVVKHVV
ncbi:MAG: type I-E CRISPR-associated protein Cas7/Cse4/CasC [Thermoguttaceae bacterium]